MQSASTLFGVSFAQALRKGQERTVALSVEPNRTKLNVQLPTGYGKTLTAAAVYSVLKNQNRVNRLLYIVPTTAQLNQFVQDGSSDLLVAGVKGSPYITDIGYSGITAIKNHRNGKSQVFACTIQGFVSKNVHDVVIDLMESGSWMVVFDEYHHYGNAAKWGISANELIALCKFCLAMSATPYRINNDSAFGQPDLSVSYSDAVTQKAVKPLRCLSYVYRVDMIEKDGTVRSYTTDQFIEEICEGKDSPDQIDKIMIDREMRWSPKYVSPLVDMPVSRLLRDRIRTDYPLQALVGAMSCSHAKLVCEQIRSMYPDLRVDWVGTGENGRTESENREILNKFCPKKVDGRRNPQDVKLDVLVHVAMAGEGLDSVYVSEVIHLNPANINNSNHQENGRAARFLEGVVGTINVDSSSPYAQYLGDKIMKVMDDPYASPDDDVEEDSESGNDDGDLGNVDQNDDDDRLPEEPRFRAFDMECIRVDEGELRRMTAAMLASIKGLSLDELNNPNHPLWKELDENRDHPIWQKAEFNYRNMRIREHEQHNERSMIEQWSEKVKEALASLASRIARIVMGQQRFEKSMVGDIMKRINVQKAKEIGKIEKDVLVVKRHYKWIVDLEEMILSGNKEIPEWLR